MSSELYRKVILLFIGKRKSMGYTYNLTQMLDRVSTEIGVSAIVSQLEEEGLISYPLPETDGPNSWKITDLGLKEISELDLSLLHDKLEKIPKTELVRHSILIIQENES